MKLKIKDVKAFKNVVFGADCFLLYYPALLTTGVEVEWNGERCYIIGGNDTTFFSTLEIETSMEFVE